MVRRIALPLPVGQEWLVDGDFGDEGGWGQEECRRNRSEKQQLQALGFSGDARLTRSVVHGSTWQWKPG